MRCELVEAPVYDTRGDTCVVIFPSRPYWFAASVEIKAVVGCFSLVDDASIINGIAEALEIDREEARETFETVRGMLYGAGVLSQDGQLSPDVKEYAPAAQVNEVENVLVIAATQACNLSCAMCYARAARAMPDEMTTDEIVGILDQLTRLPWGRSMSRVALTGGEFFTRPDAMRLIEEVHSRGYYVQLNTNATLLTDDQVLGLAEFPNLHVSISLDGSKASTHEYIRGLGTFEITTRRIEQLCMAGVNVALNMFVHRGNLHDIQATLRLANWLGARGFNCLNMMNVGRANDSRAKSSLAPVPLAVFYRAVFDAIKDEADLQRLMLNSTFANQLMGVAAGVKSHTCGIGTNRAVYVKADGSLYPCADTAIPAFRLGNLKTDDLGAIWDGSELLRELRTLNVDDMNDVCAACPVRYYCGGNCRGEHVQNGGDLRGPHFKCEELKAAIIELMWMLVERPDLYQEKVDRLHQAVSAGV